MTEGEISPGASLPQSAAPTAPSQRGPNSAAVPRCWDAEDAVPYVSAATDRRWADRAVRPYEREHREVVIPARCCRNGYSLFVWPEKIRPSISHASASALVSFLIGKSGAVCIMSTKCPQSTCRFRRALFSSVEPSSK